MAKRVTINDKRLTKQQVKELLSEGAVYDKQVSNAINRQMGHKVLDIYRLPDGNYLYVWRSIETGKGDIWPREYVEKEKQKRERKRPHLKGMSSVDHWYYFSKTKETFPEQIHSLISALFQRLGLSEKNIDYTYDSLDLLAERLDTTKEDVVEAEFYDGIVAYLGEILIRKINGKWDFACGADARIAVRPLIVTKHPWVQYDPITPIFIALRGVQGFRLRQNLVDEIRRHELDRNAFLKEQ